MDTLKLSDLQNLSESERSHRLSEFYRQEVEHSNGARSELDEQIRELERLHELPSSELVAELEAGRLRETASVCRWLMLLRLRDRLECSS